MPGTTQPAHRESESGTPPTAFLSYAREDREFVLAIAQSLNDIGVDTSGDWLISPTVPYEEALRSFIQAANTFVFFIGPHSVGSKACRDEIDYAFGLNKRLAPVVIQDVDDDVVHGALRPIQYTFIKRNEDIAAGAALLKLGIETDLEWERIHNRLLRRALDWNNKSRNTSLTLRKDDLQEAETWLAQAGTDQNKKPRPLELQTEYIFASRRDQKRRQRFSLAAVSFGFLVAIALALVAFWQYRVAKAQAVEAQRQKTSAESNLQKAIDNEKEANHQRELAKENERTARKNEIEANEQRKLAEQRQEEAEQQRQIAETRRLEAVRSAAEAQATADRESLNRLGLTFLEQGEDNEAIDRLKTLRDIYTQPGFVARGDKRNGLWWTQHNLGVAYSRVRIYQLSESAYIAALTALDHQTQILNQSQAPSHHRRAPFSPTARDETILDRSRSTVATLRRLAQLYREWAQNTGFEPERNKRIKASIDTYNKVRELLSLEPLKSQQLSYRWDVDIELADTYTELGTSEGDAAAFSLYQSGRDQFHTAHKYVKELEVLKKWADFAFRSQKSEVAVDRLKDALVVEETHLGWSPISLEISQTYSEIAEYDQSDGDNAGTAGYDVVAKRIREFVLASKTGPFTPEVVHNLANAYIRIGKCDRAERVYQDAVDIGDRTPLEGNIFRKHFYHLDFLANLGEVYWKNRRNPKAASEYFDRFVKESTMTPPPLDLDVPTNYATAADFYLAQGKFDDANTLLARESDIRAADLEKHSDDIQWLPYYVDNQAEVIVRIARALEAEGKITEAEAKFVAALNLVREKLNNLNGGNVKVGIAYYIFQLAEFQIRQGRSTKATTLQSAYDTVLQGANTIFEVGLQAQIEKTLATQASNEQTALALDKRALRNLLVYESLLSSVMRSTVQMSAEQELNGQQREFDRYSEYRVFTPSYYSDLAEIYEALSRLEPDDRQKVIYGDMAAKQREKLRELQLNTDLGCKIPQS